MAYITREQILAIDPTQDPADVVADLNAAAFSVGAPYAFKAVAFNALGVTTAWQMNPSLAHLLRAHPEILRGN